MKYIFVDTETGGLSPDTSLLELGMILTDSKFNIEDEVLYKLRPDDDTYRVTGQALGINNINLVEHNSKSLRYKDAKPYLYDKLYNWSFFGRDKLVPVGKNIYFDLTRIWQHLLSKPTWEQFVSYQQMDISAVVRYLQLVGKIPAELPKTSLSDLCNHFDIGIGNDLHTSNGDNRIAIEIMRRLVQL